MTAEQVERVAEILKSDAMAIQRAHLKRYPGGLEYWDMTSDSTRTAFRDYMERQRLSEAARKMLARYRKKHRALAKEPEA